MQVIEQISIDDNILLSSNVVEDDHATWDGGAAYSPGDKVIYSHKIYEALNDTTGDQPDASPTIWNDLGATNRWKMFDDKVGTRTINQKKIEIEIQAAGVVQAVALLECHANKAQVIVEDAYGEVYNKEKDFGVSIPVSNWWHYFFSKTERRDNLIFDDLPSHWNSKIKIIISTTPAEIVECGTCIVGNYHVFGKAVRMGAMIGITDYSRKVVDEWGNIEIVERPYAKRASWEIRLDRSQVDRFFKTLVKLRARPAIYIGGTKEDVTFIYGFPKDWNIVIDYPKWVHCNVEIEGVI